ncbi:hypothetical protein lerEdw1_019493 [Lerista edwardsae]|nr:hypothetical protein lerEdw1_019493 [Lerista edwardsae]
MLPFPRTGAAPVAVCGLAARPSPPAGGHSCAGSQKAFAYRGHRAQLGGCFKQEAQNRASGQATVGAWGSLAPSETLPDVAAQQVLPPALPSRRGLAWPGPRSPSAEVFGYLQGSLVVPRPAPLQPEGRLLTCPLWTAAAQNPSRRLRAAFLHWRAASAQASSQRGLLVLAAGHRRRRLLSKCLAGWRQHHLQRVRAMLLQRQGDWLRTQRLLSSFLSLWKTQLAQRRQERRETVRALWHWARSLQGEVRSRFGAQGPKGPLAVVSPPPPRRCCTGPQEALPKANQPESFSQVFDAWLRFVREQRRKKGRIQRAVEVYRAGLLREGATCILRFAAGMKHFRGQLQAQHQLQASREELRGLPSPGSRGQSPPAWVVCSSSAPLSWAAFVPHVPLLGLGLVSFSPVCLLGSSGGRAAGGRLPGPGRLELHLARGLEASFPPPPYTDNCLLGWASERGPPMSSLPSSLPLTAPLRSQAAHHRHQSVYRCAMLWKQKALCRKAGQASLGLLKRRVTFQVPLPAAAASGASGDPGAAAGQRRLPQPTPRDGLPFPPAAGASVLTEL